jgi:hypothetical protein
MPIISSHHTVVFIVVTLLHSLFTSGRTFYWYRLLNWGNTSSGWLDTRAELIADVALHTSIVWILNITGKRSWQFTTVQRFAKMNSNWNCVIYMS